VIYLLAITGTALLVSFVADRRKTWAGVVKAARMFLGILPMLVGILAAVSLLLAAVPTSLLERALGGGVVSFVAALFVGSITLMPGFIAYPLAGVLRDNGASVGVLAAFITTLMMVGIVTLPLEMRMFGRRFALLRNGLAFAGAVVVAVVMALVLR
jgi:uncharacterized membrane protein YraQ (UPF0718 family)